MPKKFVLFAVLAAAISVSAFDYGLDRGQQAARMREHDEIIHDSGFAPNRYRILVPFAVEPLIALASRIADHAEAFRLVYAGVYAAGLWLFVAVLFSYLRQWFSEAQALVGVLLTACLLPMALRYHTYAAWSIFEPTFLIAALMAIHRGRDGWVLPLTIGASLNRETGVLVPLALLIDVAADRPLVRRRVVAAAVDVGVSIAIFVLLRVWRGNVRSVVSLADVWRMNSSGQGLKTFVPAIVLFLGGTGWILAVRGWSRTPIFVRRSVWLALFYVPLYLLFGYWYEVRLLTTLYPVLVPALLAGIFPPRDGTDARG